MKKILLATVLVFAFALTINYAFAGYERRDNDKCNTCPDVKVEIDNYADIDNDIKAESNTGENKIEAPKKDEKKSRFSFFSYRHRGGEEESANSIVTGNAYADANADNKVGKNIVEITQSEEQEEPGFYSFFSRRHKSEPKETGGISVEIDNEADIDNDIEAEANSGENEIEDGSGSITTGAAESWASAINLVGYNVVKITK